MHIGLNIKKIWIFYENAENHDNTAALQRNKLELNTHNELLIVINIERESPAKTFMNLW